MADLNALTKKIEWAIDALDESGLHRFRRSNPGPLLEACIDGDAARLRKHIAKARPTVASVRQHGTMPLVAAAVSGSLPVVNLLLDLGLDVEDVRAEDCAAFRKACACSRADIVARYLGMGLTLEDLRALDNDALVSAASDGALEVVRALFAAGLGAFDAQARGGEALSLAVAHGFADVAEELLAAGAKPTPESLRMLRRHGQISARVLARWEGTREMAWASGPDAFERWLSEQELD